MTYLYKINLTECHCNVKNEAYLYRTRTLNMTLCLIEAHFDFSKALSLFGSISCHILT